MALSSVEDVIFYELCMECEILNKLSRKLCRKIDKLDMERRKQLTQMTRHGYTPLFIAIKHYKLANMDYLVDKCDADIEYKCSKSVAPGAPAITPLYYASQLGNLNVVHWLLKRGADANGVSDGGRTPVSVACYRSHFRVLECLVEHGADVKRPNDYGQTCLMFTAGCFYMCKFVLKHVQDVNSSDSDGDTALHYAVREECLECVQLLLNSGAIPIFKNNSDEDILFITCLKGSLSIFNYLITSRVEYNTQRQAEAYELMACTLTLKLIYSPSYKLPIEFLHKALQLRQQIGGKSLPSFGPDVALPRFPFHEIPEYSSKQDLDDISTDNYAFHIQILLILERLLGPLHEKTTQLLHALGKAHVDCTDLQRSIDFWLYEMMLKVVKHRLRPSSKSIGVLDLACAFLRLLEDYGDDAEIVRYCDVYCALDTFTAHMSDVMELAKVGHVRERNKFNVHFRVIIPLIYVLFKIPKNAFQEVEMKDLVKKIIAMRLSNCLGDSLLHLSTLPFAMKNVSPYDGKVPVVQMSAFSFTEVVDLLLECGHDVNLVNRTDCSPLHMAARSQNVAAVTSLLEHGAHIDQRDGQGIPAFQLFKWKWGLEVFPLPLKCLAAHTILRHRIPYQAVVSQELNRFINHHIHFQ